jgi:hypothetical protein
MVTDNTTDDSYNYVQPLTAAGPTKFTSTATAANAEVAESLALSEARSKAIETYGVGTTEFVSFDNISTKITGSSPPFTYTTTATVSVIQLEEVREPSPIPVRESTTDISPSSDPGVQQGTPFDDDGNLNPGWELDENNNPVFVGFGQGVSSIPEMVITASRIPKRDSAPQPPPPPADWRVRISIAKGSNYFYNDSDPGSILLPLKATDGVIFPYTPTISVSYSAQYDQQTLPHSNFKSTNYGSSSVDSVTVGGDFTAQDVNEANYLLAVIHFFRSATKMFYGKDENPNRGVPPPLLYLSGLGQYQFDNHPMVLQSFNYSLPNDVDYINAYPGGAATSFDGTPLAPFSKPAAPKPNAIVGGINRLFGVGLKPGGTAKPPIFITPPIGNNNATRVPTKISISLTFLPVVTRRAISNEFSLKKYASGQLLRGSVNPGTGGGIW